MSQQNVGAVTAINGPVLDIRFADGHLPELLNAVRIETASGAIVAEVAQHLGDDVVRCIAMSSTDGLVRGTPAVDTGASISVPVGKETLGRVFNVELSKSAASSQILAVTGTKLGRGVSQVLVGRIPGVGNALNAATAAAVTELLGWAVAENFAKAA